MLCPWHNEVRAGWLCCPGIKWEPIRETSSHTTRRGTLVHSCSDRWVTVDWSGTGWANWSLLFKTKCRRKLIHQTFPPKSSYAKKKKKQKSHNKISYRSTSLMNEDPDYEFLVTDHCATLCHCRSLWRTRTPKRSSGSFSRLWAAPPPRCRCQENWRHTAWWSWRETVSTSWPWRRCWLVQWSARPRGSSGQTIKVRVYGV